MNITLDRIAALIKKLEEEHPEANNMIRISMYDDFSGRFEYNVYSEKGGFYVKRLTDFYSEGSGTLDELMRKYGV